MCYHYGMNILTVFFFISLMTLATVHIVALKFFLYWKYLWLDIPVHILGGICVAFGIAILPFFRIVIPYRYQTLTAYILGVLLVGVLWELFEIWAGIPLTQEGFAVDAITDLCMDVLGAVVGYGIVKSIQKL